MRNEESISIEEASGHLGETNPCWLPAAELLFLAVFVIFIFSTNSQPNHSPFLPCWYILLVKPILDKASKQRGGGGVDRVFVLTKLVVAMRKERALVTCCWLLFLVMQFLFRRENAILISS